ncbi:LysR family transcriptional regulator [uncultured Paenalcaligenes sp.]|uniref:LysR family transcriptional regulator n=1 Tax=uncultured Paenalcaligenes sp. TaxID=1588925 RepID=UPI00263961B0|nr:LysR family transcriptional regulator [uncultured Paenalcaligenes sp.]
MQSLAFKYFYEVAQQGSLSGASESLHVAVSAVSRQINQLEQRVGTTLFERSARGMRLTVAGQMLLKHVRRVNLETDATFQAIASLQDAVKHPIRLACTQGVAHELVPSVMAQFHLAYPHSRFDVFVSSAKVATERVATGEADIAITFSTTPAENVAVRYSCNAPALAIMSTQHPLAKRKRLFLDDVQKYPLALTDKNTSTFKLYQLACNRTGKWVEPSVYSNHAEALHAYVRDTQAVLFASYVSVSGRLQASGLVAIPIKNTEMHARVVQLQVMQGRELPEIMELFINSVTQRIQEINEQAPS